MCVGQIIGSRSEMIPDVKLRKQRPKDRNMDDAGAILVSQHSSTNTSRCKLACQSTDHTVPAALIRLVSIFGRAASAGPDQGKRSLSSAFRNAVKINSGLPVHLPIPKSHQPRPTLRRQRRE
jgi:hypothetical protein